MFPQLSASPVPLKVPFIKHVILLLRYPNNTRVPGSQCETQHTSLGIFEQASETAFTFSSPRAGQAHPLADGAPVETVKVSHLKTAQHGSQVNVSNF